eukprot:IDg18368t1
MYVPHMLVKLLHIKIHCYMTSTARMNACSNVLQVTKSKSSSELQDCTEISAAWACFRLSHRVLSAPMRKLKHSRPTKRFIIVYQNRSQAKAACVVRQDAVDVVAQELRSAQ